MTNKQILKMQKDIESWNTHLKLFEEYFNENRLKLARMMLSDLVESLETAEDFLIIESSKTGEKDHGKQ